ncbi:MAG: hypothetical protein R3293_28875 [Candidatus Promineifilaceae bacterium]|nr:hypothetical protein [Candidatus Promineifilaceae bacterium]
MNTFTWNKRAVLTVIVAVVIALSVAGLGIWAMIDGITSPGFTHIHHQNSGDSSHAGTEHSRFMASANHARMMGSVANRGFLGGYSVLIGVSMIVLSIAMVGILLFSLLKERPVLPRQTTCPHCGRPVETDWTDCPFCESALEQVKQ